MRLFHKLTFLFLFLFIPLGVYGLLRPSQKGIEQKNAVLETKNTHDIHESAPLVLSSQSHNETSWDHIFSLISCPNVRGDCPIPDIGAEADTQSSMVANAILEELILLQYQWKQSKPDRGRLEDLVKGLLEYPDERVKLAALRLVNETQNVDDSRLSILFAQLEDAVDPELIVEALKILRGYMHTPYEEDAMAFVEKILFTGSFQASRQMAQSAAILLYEGNRARFERWVTELPANTPKQQMLEASLAGH